MPFCSAIPPLCFPPPKREVPQSVRRRVDGVIATSTPAHSFRASPLSQHALSTANTPAFRSRRKSQLLAWRTTQPSSAAGSKTPRACGMRSRRSAARRAARAAAAGIRTQRACGARKTRWRWRRRGVAGWLIWVTAAVALISPPPISPPLTSQPPSPENLPPPLPLPQSRRPALGRRSRRSRTPMATAASNAPGTGVVRPPLWLSPGHASWR